MRQAVNGVMYIPSTGCQRRYIPKDLPPRSTVNEYFCLWSYNGTLEKIHDLLYVKCREQAEREASPTACIINSQSVKSAEKGGLYRSAWVRRRQADKVQEASRSRRQAGLLLHALVTPADVQDRDGGLMVLSTLFGQFPFLQLMGISH
jgi:transposase